VKQKALLFLMALCMFPLLVRAGDDQLQREIQRLQQQTRDLQTQLNQMQKKMASHPSTKKRQEVISAHDSKSGDTKHAKRAKKQRLAERKSKADSKAKKSTDVHSSAVTVHSINGQPESVEFFPAALIADGHVVTYIGGMPVVTSPYLGAYPAFDGSDYIVNISSINRDIRLMQQRRRLYRSFERLGYPEPNLPILALSGKAEPIGSVGRDYFGHDREDWTLGSSELDVAAAINQKVEAYIGIAFDESPPARGGPRVANSAFNLNLGFVNIGDLDATPFYFTAGQLYVPFGRYSTSMISATLPLRLSRTKSRPFILGYKSQEDSGPFAALYGYRGDTTLGTSGVGGVNLGYVFNWDKAIGEVGGSFISSLNDAGGMQATGSAPLTTFGGFGSVLNGNEDVKKIPGIDFHGTVSFDRYSITAEWVSSLGRFREQDLSFNGVGAQPQAMQLEAGVTFMAFDRPSSIAGNFQWTKDALALNIPYRRISGVFNISIWKDTVESLEYRHDINYRASDFGNGASAPGFSNGNTWGTGTSADTVIAQIGVYF
jgi:hypothetical protein